MIQEITEYLNQYDLDVRKTGDARFMDQKCTPDVVCFIADCILNLNPQGEFTVQDIWDMQYFIKSASAIFGKPSPRNETARHEYDKFIQQPLRMLAYAHVLSIEKRGATNYYSIENLDILDFIATKERNAYNFLYAYIIKVLADSNMLRHFETFKEKCKNNTVTKQDYRELKDKYTRFIIGNTAINGMVEVYRIFTKIINVYAAENDIRGTEKGRLSNYNITFSDLMYNRKNWRDTDKPKAQTRQEAATAEDIRQQEEYDAYQVTKAMNLLRKIQTESEVKDQYANGDATQVHHIFPKSEFPAIAHYLENLVKLTATQHYTKAHPNNRTQIINHDYQLVCLLAKSQTIELSLRQVGEKYYRKESFIVVINTGLNADLNFSLTFPEIRTELRHLYNNVA
ncbi:MAG: hypothetical protein IJ911_01690 [Salinivirgaceae bacterium]|nr:hypothetical protein [Salinivirgaceae bacterium]